MTVEIVSIRDVPAGELLFHAGTPATEAFVVKEGTVTVLAFDRNGEERPVATAGPGHIVGEAALLAPGPYPYSARAESDTHCLVIDRHALDGKLDASDPFIRALFDILSGNLESILDKITAADRRRE